MSVRQTWVRVRIVTPQLVDQPSEVFEFTPERPRASALRGLQNVSVEQRMGGLNAFTLTFAPDGIDEGTSWARRIPQYSLVEVQMGSSEAPDDDPLIMIGLTSPGTETENFVTWTRQVVITGLGIERVLHEATVWRAPWLALHNIEAELDRVTRGPFNQRMTGQPVWTLQIFKGVRDPREALLRILFFFLVDHANSIVNLLLPPPFRIFDLLVPGDFTDEDVDATSFAYHPENDGTLAAEMPRTWRVVDPRLKITSAAITRQAGSVLNFLNACVDPVFQEFFVRYQGGKARILFRPKPFATRERADEALKRGATLFADGVADLETVTITREDVLQASLRYGSEPVFNVFYARPASTAILQDKQWYANVPPMFSGRQTDEAYLGRFGLRVLDHVSPYLLVDQGVQDMATATAIARDLNATLKSWFDPQPVVQQGSIVLKGRAAYRCGQRLVWNPKLDRRGQGDGRPPREFYIEGVRQSYDVETGTWHSHLTVSRGWQLGGDVGPDGARVLPTKKPRPAPTPATE